MFNLICPKCGSNRIHHSRRRDFVEKILAPVGARTRRCHACDSRFLQLGASLMRIDDVRRALRRVTLGVGVLLAAVLVLAVILWIDRAQSNQGPESFWKTRGGAGTALQSC
jgi:hypothetical protein